MKARESAPKKRRIVLSFEMDPDVAVMLDRAKQAGLVQGQIINEALRECGPKVIKAQAEKLSNKLSSLSFNRAQLPLVGFAA